MLHNILYYVLYGINAGFFVMAANGAYAEFHDPEYGGNKYDLYFSFLFIFAAIANVLAMAQV